MATPWLPAILAPLLLLLVLGGGSSNGGLSGAHACTSYIVGRDASAGRTVIIARNDDGDGAVSPNTLVYHPPRQGPAIFRANLNKLQVELPGPGLAYFSLPAGPMGDAASGRNTSGEAAGVNAAGVAVSGTESIYNSPAALAADPLVPDGIIEDAIPSLLLPQATSARHGAELLGRLVSQHGAGEAFGVLFADADEAWYLETGSGHHWLAQRVPHHSFFISANQGRFQDVDLTDPSSALASPGLERFAAKAGLWDPASRRPLNFFSAFMRDGVHDVNYSYPRVCLLQHLFGGCGLACNAPSAPVFMHPQPRKLAPQDIMAAMRSHWDGSSHDPYLHHNPDETWRPIALLRTGMGHVTVMRPRSHNLPDGLSFINYVAMSTPKLSPFIPLYKGLPGDALPPELTVAEARKPDHVSIFWRARRLHALVFQDWPTLAPAAAEAIVLFEESMEAEMPSMEAEYIRLTRQGHEGHAGRHLAAFTQRVARLAGELLDGLAADAAEALGLPAVPDDDRMLQMLEEAAEAYAFEPTSDDDAPKSSSDGAAQQADGGGGSSLFALRNVVTH